MHLFKFTLFAFDITMNFMQMYLAMPVPVAELFKAYVCGHSPAQTMGLNPAGGMDICCECYVLSGRGLCDELITRPEESYRL